MFLNGCWGYKISIEVFGIDLSDYSTKIFRNHHRQPECTMSQIEKMDNFRYIDLVDHDLRIIGKEQHLVQSKFILKVQSVHFMDKVFSN